MISAGAKRRAGDSGHEGVVRLRCSAIRVLVSRAMPNMRAPKKDTTYKAQVQRCTLSRG